MREACSAALRIVVDIGDVLDEVDAALHTGGGHLPDLHSAHRGPLGPDMTKQPRCNFLSLKADSFRHGPHGHAQKHDVATARFERGAEVLQPPGVRSDELAEDVADLLLHVLL